MTDIQGQVAQAIFNRSHQPDDPLSLPDSEVNALAAALTPLVERAQAEAWDEGAESAFYDPEIRGFVDYPDNPYIEREAGA